jgi:hypothetical protein
MPIWHIKFLGRPSPPALCFYRTGGGHALKCTAQQTGGAGQRRDNACFVRLRRILAENAGLARRLDELEKKYDVQFKVVFDTIRQLMLPPEPKKKRIGFITDDDKPGRANSDSDFVARDRPARRNCRP